MNASIAFSLLALFLQESQVPYKPANEFEVQIDYQFKQKTGPNPNTIDFVETQEEHDKKRYGTGLRPYLILNVKLIKLSDLEVKARAANNVDRTLFNKKVKAGDFIKIDMGFTDDIKDRVGPYAVTIVFTSREKKQISRIYMYVEENGVFAVNGEMRGKF